MRIVFFEGLMIACMLYALIRGGAPERIGATLLTMAYFLTILAYSEAPVRFRHFEVGVFLVDLGLFLALYLLSLFTRRFWPLWMSAMQGVAVLSHLVILAAPWEIYGYAIMIQFWGYPIQALLVVATRRHQLRLTRDGADPAWTWSA